MRRRASKHDFEDAEGAGPSRTLEQRIPTTFAYAEELIPKFSGRDQTVTASRWVQEVEENAEIFGWSPLHQLIVGRRSLIGTAALWLRSEKPFRSWDELKTGLLKEFPDSLDVKTVHEMMSARKKANSESCTDYLLVMKELGRRGKMPDYVAIKYIIDGIVDVETNKIMLYGATTYGELKEKLKVYETVKAKMVDERRRPSSSSTTAPGNYNKTTRPRCFNCGGSNHISAQCFHKEKGVKCFRCNMFGHRSSECSKPANHQQVTSENSKWQSDNRQQRHASPKRAMFTETPERYNVANMTQSTTDWRSRPNVERNAELTDDTSANLMVSDVNNKSVKTSRPLKEVQFVDNNAITTAGLIDTGSEVNLMTEDVYKTIGSPKYDDGRCLTLSGLGRTEVVPLGKVILSMKIDNDCFKNVLFYVVNNSCLPYSVILGFVGDSQFKEQLTELVETYQPLQVKEAPIELKIVLKDDIPVAQRPRRVSLREQQVVEDQVEEWLAKNIIRRKIKSRLWKD
ncbi:uncharacterized protein LOC135079329 isoform X1 [Ostrinia nubilalis]|uniref:uncharacterized protein LOC135079329 isoform X1 n=1 Tax=Ostrinia nubilalis TaxID=29057 RepID=UPI003082686E